MGYQILRFEKIKTRQSLEGRCKHATGERQPQNADPALKGENQVAEGNLDFHGAHVVLTNSREFRQAAVEGFHGFLEN